MYAIIRGMERRMEIRRTLCASAWGETVSVECLYRFFRISIR